MRLLPDGFDCVDELYADDHGEVAKLRPFALLDRGIEGVAVDMGDGEIVQLRVPEDARRSAGRAVPAKNAQTASPGSGRTVPVTVPPRSISISP